MIVESIKLNHFRNYDRLELDFHKGTNLFYGDNAQGKTNILESVYLCGTTRSHKGSKDREIIHFGEEESHICMRIRKGDIPYRIDMHLKKNKAKGIAINGVPVKKASELIGLGNFVFFSPEDLNIIKNGPSERRRFLDMEMCQLDKIYLYHLSNYNKVLNQRNRLLKDFSVYNESQAMLDVLDEQLVLYGSDLIRLRSVFVSELNEILRQIHSSLSGRKETLVLEYEANACVDMFENALKKNREKDVRTRLTNAGPHRDDLCFLINGIDIRKYGSQGQQRTAALSLKLAEIELVKQNVKDTPVLLLDDVLSELDSSRQKYLLESIHDIQTMITCTGIDDFVSYNFQINKLFQVICGTVHEK
ncbi:DNA replication/repair protein RecF [Parablautia sp. Marseille-Q6255]|uniref:DNA replication/repair protein RecF n=1 Tax=Parablautia sp. Marseille-Q6255 TaxID=3039593 RepID=UPI0024BBFE46|nr:DNA replication/repair protein RecF [Parablautia sp. Marseille-Q6255]